MTFWAMVDQPEGGEEVRPDWLVFQVSNTTARSPGAAPLGSATVWLDSSTVL